MTGAQDPPAEEDFFSQVREHLTPPMESHGYLVCAESEGWTSGDEGPLLLRRTSWRGWDRLRSARRWTARGRRTRQLTVGYEGEADEYWVSYLPERRELDLRDWVDLARGHADWDVGCRARVTRTELRRRLLVVGQAVTAAESLERG